MSRDPQISKDVDKLLQIQGRVAGLIKGIHGLINKQTLKELNMYSWAPERFRAGLGDLTTVY